LAAARAIDRGKEPVRAVRRASRSIATARPTAVNLSSAVERSLAGLDRLLQEGREGEAIVEGLATLGSDLLEADLEASRRMARHGVSLLPEGKPVLTHCNTGGLATGGLGTALAVIRYGAALGMVPEVYVDETRPLLQGGRLTIWELRRGRVPARLLCDGAAAWAMQTEGIGAVLVGADRIARNGDTANKIGTFPLAIAAQRFGIPFYVVAPWTSFDPDLPDGSSIRIEERAPAEVVRASGWAVAGEVPTFNPAFDLTPAGLVTAWITDRGVLHPPFTREDPETGGSGP
jgi:methylthioribose-1-phosphate isomerase